MQCLHPITVKNHSRGLLPRETFYVEVPCGHCIACRLNKQRDWVTRCLMELIYPWQGKASFVTLTYGDEFLPPDGALHKKELQDFFKRLRDHMDGKKLRYFACGEYGDENGRPHFHMILYGFTEGDREALERSWTKGFVSIGSVTPQSIRYCIDYILKNVSDASVYPESVKPFALFSKSLGRAFFELYGDSVKKDGYFQFGDKQYPIPKYFKERFYTRYERYKDKLALVPDDLPPDYKLIEDRLIRSMKRRGKL